MKRRPFILLETLVCLAIITLCGSFFVARPLIGYKLSLKNLIEVELEREAINSFKDLLINLRSQHKFDSFTRNKNDSPTFFLPDKIIKIDSKYNFELERSYRFSFRKENEGVDGHHAKVLRCWILLKSTRHNISKEYKYEVFLTKNMEINS